MIIIEPLHHTCAEHHTRIVIRTMEETMKQEKKRQEQKDKTQILIEDLLKSRKHGLTITEIMQKTGLARHTVLARLHYLEGSGPIEHRKINMAKLYYWKEDNEDEDEQPHPLPEEKKEHHHLHQKHVKMRSIKEHHLRKQEKKTIHSEQSEARKESKKESRLKGSRLDTAKLDMAKLKEEIEAKLKDKKITNVQAQIKEQREPIKHKIEKIRKDKVEKKERKGKEYFMTGVPGFDDLLVDGIPQGASVIVAGGAGSGKTIFCSQILNHYASQGKKCLYMSFEESEERLIEHMEDFGWDPKHLIKKGTLMIKRFNPFDITRSVDALLMKARGELLIDIEPIIFPPEFVPEMIVVDSLTAIGSAFSGKEDSYRIYIEQLFRFFEKMKTLSFLVSETEQIPTKFSDTGVEEFLADGVIVLYSMKHGNIRENAIEVLKLRGAEHKKRIVAFKITREGVVVYPEQEIFEEIE